MTSLAIAKLVSDALLFGALLFLSFRVLRRQAINGPHLMRLKELEQSLKEITRQADDASQNLSEELLSRKRDLERVLTEAQKIEDRLAKSEVSVTQALRSAERKERDLELIIERAGEVTIPAAPRHEPFLQRNAPEPMLDYPSKAERHQSETFARQAIPKHSELSTPTRYPSSSQSRFESNARESTTQPLSSSFEYNTMLEPPSFSQISETTAKRISPHASNQVPLSKKVETLIERERTLSQPRHNSGQQVKESIRSVAAAAERALDATSLPDHLEDALAETERQAGQVASLDPRLGVLGGFRRTTQVV